MMAASSSNLPNDSRALAVVLRTTLSLLDSYAPCVRESNSLRDLERALICAISDLKRVDARERERMVQGTMQN